MRLYFDLISSDGTIDINKFHDEVLFASRHDPTTLSDAIGFVIWVVFEVLKTSWMYYSDNLDLSNK